MSDTTNGWRADASYRVGEWVVDAKRCTLVRNGTTAKVSPRSMSVLAHLAERASTAVSQDELLKTLWPRSSNSPNGLHKCISELREVFGDVRQDATYLETIPKRGYRLIASVTPIEVTAERSQDLLIFSIGTRTALLKPIDSTRTTNDVRAFVERIYRMIVTRLGQLANVSIRAQRVPADQVTRSNLAAELGVDYIVDFEAHATGEQVFATLTASPTSNALPAYEKHFESSVALTDITTQAVDDLVVLLDDAHTQRMRKWGTRNVHAYRDALEGDLLCRSESFASTKRAAELFTRALEKDPRFAMVYRSLAHAYHNMGMTAKDTATREQVRQQLQALHRKAIQWQVDPEAVLEVERQSRFVSLVNPFDAEVFWRAEIIKNPSNAEAMRRYGDLLLGSKLTDESAAYLARSIALTDEDRRDWVEQDEVNLAGARGEVERAISLMKRNLDRFPDHTMSTFGLVQTLARHGRYAEAEAYLSRLVATDAPWAFFGKMMLMALRGDMPAGSNQLAHAFSDPLANNANRGFICFVLGDVEAGVRYWQEIEPGFLPMLWQSNVLNEGFWAPGVVEDRRYQALLDDLGFGRRWRAYMRTQVAELTPITGIQVTTPPAPHVAVV